MQWFLYCLEENKAVSTSLSSARVKYSLDIYIEFQVKKIFMMDSSDEVMLSDVLGSVSIARHTEFNALKILRT